MFLFIFDDFWNVKSLANHCVYDTKREFALRRKVTILACFFAIKSQPQTSNFITCGHHIFLKITMQQNSKHQIRVVYTTLREGPYFTNFIVFFLFS